MGQAVEEGSAPLEITITTNEEDKTITIQDTVRIDTREGDRFFIFWIVDLRTLSSWKMTSRGASVVRSQSHKGFRQLLRRSLTAPEESGDVPCSLFSLDTSWHCDPPGKTPYN